MGDGIKFAIEDVRKAATAFAQDADAFKERVTPVLDSLELSFFAFPLLYPNLHRDYGAARQATVDVSNACYDSLVAIGKGLAAVATYYEGVEQRHAKELGIS